MKRDFDKERCEILAEYLIERDATVRAVAYAFSISKSTVHKDITEKVINTRIELMNEQFAKNPEKRKKLDLPVLLKLLILYQK